MSATTRLTITASGSGASNANGGNAGQSGEISVPNTGIINHADAPFAIGGIILFFAVLLIIFKRHHKNSFHIFKKRTFTLSIVTLLVLSGLAVALPKLQQTNEAQAYEAALTNLDEYLAIDSSSVGQLELNLSDFAGQEVAYIKDTITVNEVVSEPHTVHFKITPTSWVPFSEAFVYTTDDPTSADATWQPVTTDRIAAVGAETATNGKTYDIYYGVRLGEIPAGTYSVDINYDTLVDFDGTMQAMNQKICQRLPLETNVVLRDVRDDNYYTIMRAADDSCWMTEDLRLALSAKKALTNADTDLNTKNSWKPSMGTMYEHYDEHDDEYYFYADPSHQTLISNPCEDTHSDYERKICSFDHQISIEDDYYNNGTVWYDWSAATASSLSYNDMLNRTNEGEMYVAEDSICPKGWQMPFDAHFDSLFNANGRTQFSKLGLYTYFNLPEITQRDSELYIQIYDESYPYLNSYGGTNSVRCVLSYVGEATLTLGRDVQTAETSRMGVEFTVPMAIPKGSENTGDFLGYVAINPEHFHVYDTYYNMANVQVYEPGETYTFYAPHTILYPLFEFLSYPYFGP
jgi:hypothetical protein